MARARNIKPGFFRNEILAELEPLTRILFAGLWTVADREGRLEDRPRRIKADVLPYDDDADVDAMLAALAEKSFIARYKYGASSYIQIIQFDKHQNPHKGEAQSSIPPMDTAEPSATDSGNVETTNPAGTGKSPEHSKSTVQTPESNSTNLADSLNTDSLIPDSGLLERSCAHARDGADAPEHASAATTPRKPKTNRATQIPDDFEITEALRQFARDRGFTEPEIDHESEKFVNYWRTEQRPKKDWGGTWRQWILNAIDRRPKGNARASPNGSKGKHKDDAWTARDFADYALELERQGK